MKGKQWHCKTCAFILALVMVFSVIAPITGMAAETTWTLKDDTEIFWVETDTSEKDFETLEKQVQLFSSELAEKVIGTALPINYGEQDDAGANDIILVLDETLAFAAEGYEVIATESNIKIAASDADGLFYGCRDLIKQLLLNNSVASVTDAPQVSERAVSLDNGRKYFTVDWIKEFIRELSWANMNTLVLHFSEDMGLGIESQLYPWLAGRDGGLCVQANLGEDYDSRVLTQDEVREIVEYARVYHIEVIPSLDSPGHMNYIVRKFNEQCADQDFSFTYDDVTYTAEAGSEIGNYFHYNNTTSIVHGSSVPKDEYALNSSRGIDISDEVALAFTKSLIEEYATLFADLGCTKFDIGGDELLGWGSAIVSTSKASRWQQLDHWKEYAIERTGNSKAVAYDAFLLYMNDLNDLVRELGYTSVRMWNDCALLSSSTTGWSGVVQLNTNIDIWFWTTDSNSFETYADAGHEVYNILGDYCYYAMTANYFSNSRSSFAQAYADQIYNEWSPYAFGSGGNAEEDDARVLGGAFGIWCDNPSLKTEDEVMSEALPLIRACAAKSWAPEANSKVSYSTYTTNWATYGDAPAGSVTAPAVYVVADLTALEAAVAEYAGYDAEAYTETSFAVYTAAVEAGEVLLTAEKPIQTDVDAAVTAIMNAKAALRLLPTADIEALSDALLVYDQTDAMQYTSGSFAVYTGAVSAARSLLDSGEYTQAEVDEALNTINAARAALVDAEEGVECIISGSARSNRVNAGRTVILAVSVYKTVETEGVRIFDESGNEIILQATSTNTRKTDRNTYTVAFKVTAADRGTHVYTVYAVLADGTLSADFVQFTIEVR